MNIDPKSECPKCRTLNPENCHSMQCPMRKEPCAYEEECQHPACNCGSMIKPYNKHNPDAQEWNFNQFKALQSENQRLTKINEELVKEIAELKSRLIPGDALKPTDPFEPRTNIASDDENFTYGKR